MVLLTTGAESLVRGASRKAARLGIPSLIVGLTVVAFGTSAPEFAVSIQSAWSGQADIALGNVVGSNIFNVLFILGLSALIVPLAIASQLIRIDVPLMIGASVLVLLLALDGGIGRVDGAIVFSGLLLYAGFQIRQGRREQDIAVGNVVGSNVFNILGVPGLSAAVSPAGIKVAPQALQFDIPVMLAVAVACLPIFVTGREIARWEGGVFLGYYIGYATYLGMAATHHAALAACANAMLWFVLPMTAVTLVALLLRHQSRK